MNIIIRFIVISCLLITTHAHAVPLTSGLVKYLPFDNSLDNWGTLSGATVLNGTAHYTSGKLGNAAQFLNNGAGNTAPSDWAVSLGKLDTIYSKSFTLSLWVKSNSITDAAIMGNKNWSSGSNVGWVIATTPNKNLNWNTVGGSRHDVNLTITNGAWHLLTIGVNRTTNKVNTYVDNVLKDSVALATKATASLSPNPVLDTLIGSSGTGTWASKADIDEVAIWTRVLTPLEMTQVYNLANQGTSLAVQQTLDAVAPVLTATSQAKRVVLQWTSSQVALGTVTYSLYRNNTKIADTTSLTYSDLNLTPNTAYQYRVEASASGKTLASNTLSITTTNHIPAFWGSGGHYVVLDGAAVGTVLGDIRATDTDVDDTITYSLVKGATGFAVNSTTGALTVTTSPKRTAGTQRVFTVSATDGISTVSKQFTILVVTASQLNHNGVTHQLWTNIGGSAVSDLTSNSRYPKQFDTSDIWSSLTSPVDSADSYGQRLTAYLRAPKTGKYTFWIASDDASELRLASNTNPATLSATPLAFVSNWTAVNAWTTEPNQKSISVNLVRGQYYFIEVLHKEGGGGDHVEVVWQIPATTTPVAIAGSYLFTADALDSVAPSSPVLAVSQIDSTGVSLAWTTSQDNSGIANYLIYKDNALIATLANNLHSFSDKNVTGIHDYSVVAVDSYGNRSITTVLKAIDSSQRIDAIEQAIATGDSSQLLDSSALIDKALNQITQNQASDTQKVAAFYSSNINYTPGNSSQWIVPNADNEQLQPLLIGNQGHSLAIAGLAQGTRFAAFGSIPTSSFQAGNNSAYIEPFKRVLAWLLTNSASSTSSLSGVHRVALTYANSATDTRNWLTTQRFGNLANQWTVTDCNTASTLAGCYANKELLIVGRSANDADAPAIIAAITTALKNGTPVLYLHPDWGSNALSNGVANLLGFSLPYGGNWWANDSANWTDASAMLAQVFQAKGYPALTKLLTHFKNHDWNLNLTACSNNSCSAGDLQSEFYAGAKDSLKSNLNDMDNRAVDLFSLSGQRLNKLLVLLGDIFRRDIVYPLDKLKSSQDDFLRAYYADHAVYYNRTTNKAQNDLGSFSKAIPLSVPLFTKDINITTRSADYFTAAGVYAVPGQPFTVERLDTNSQAIKIGINSLRSGSTHEFDSYDYTRPKYLQSPWINLKAGQKITLSSPHGGTLQVWLQNSATPINIQLRFTQVGQHPVWNGASSTQEFKAGIAKGDYDWVEFLTPGFQIHSTRKHIIETLANPLHNTPELLADVTWKYFYQSIFNLAGFTGQDLAINNTVAAFCNTKGWDCTNPLIHGMFGVLHFNADQATCGYGCSGNPYDAYWSFEALGWGDAHEAGHNLQRARLKIDGGASTEVSNNIFPTHTAYSWNKDNPTNLQHSGHEPDQLAIFNFLNNAALQTNPSATVHQNLWVNGDVFWRLEFYRQLALQSYYLPQLGEGGWNIFTLLYLQERLFNKAINDDTAWATAKNSLGFGLYDRASANAMNGNDFMLIATSFITGKDQRAFFDLWGVTYSTTAANQVSNYHYNSAEKRFYVLSKDSNGIYWGSLNPVNSVLVNGTNSLP